MSPPNVPTDTSITDPSKVADAITYTGNSEGFDFGDILGKNSFFNQNSSLFGLAGAGFELWDGIQKRKLQEKFAEENLKMNKEKLRMTQQSYNNELYRSERISDQLAGGKSSGTGQRQYVGPTDTQPGYTTPTNPAGVSNPNSYVPHNSGPADGPSNYNATAYGPTNQNARNYAGGLAASAPKKKLNTL